METPLKRAISLTLALTLISQSVLTAQAEANFWAERKQARELRLAQLPLEVPNGVILSLPAEGGRAKNLKRSFGLRPQDDRLKISGFGPGLQKLASAVSPQHVRIHQISDSTDKTKPALLLIQDIHLHPEAQTNIAALLQNTINQQAVEFIGIEGAFEPLDFSRHRFFEDKDLTRRVIKPYLEQKWMAAPTYVGITSPAEPPPIVGVDDRAAYDAHVDAYRRSAKSQASNLKEISNIKSEIQKRKEAILNPALAEFDRSQTAYAAKGIGMGPYLRKIAGLGIKPPASVEKFIEAYNLETKIDFERVGRERKHAFEKLLPALLESKKSDLMNQSLAYQAGQMGFGDYHRYVQSLFKQNGIHLARYPAFEAYIRYVMLSDGIDAEQLFRDTRDFEKKIIDRLAGTDEERELMAETRLLSLAEKLVNFELTAEEWGEYQQFTIDDLRLTINPNAENRRSSIVLRQFEEFYRQADIRTEKIFHNLMSRADGQNKALLIGGFHSPHFIQLLKEKDIPFISVSPNITKLDSESPSEYLSIFNREKTPLEKLFTGEKISILTTKVNFPDATLYQTSLADLAVQSPVNRPLPPDVERSQLREGVEQITIDQTGILAADSRDKFEAGEKFAGVTPSGLAFAQPAAIFYKEYLESLEKRPMSIEAKIKGLLGHPVFGAPGWEWVFFIPLFVPSVLNSGIVVVAILSVLLSYLFMKRHKIKKVDRPYSLRQKFYFFVTGIILSVAMTAPGFFIDHQILSVTLGIALNIITHSLINIHLTKHILKKDAPLRLLQDLIGTQDNSIADNKILDIKDRFSESIIDRYDIDKLIRGILTEKPAILQLFSEHGIALPRWIDNRTMRRLGQLISSLRTPSNHQYGIERYGELLNNLSDKTSTSTQPPTTATGSGQIRVDQPPKEIQTSTDEDDQRYVDEDGLFDRNDRLERIKKRDNRDLVDQLREEIDKSERKAIPFCRFHELSMDFYYGHHAKINGKDGGDFKTFSDRLAFAKQIVDEIVLTWEMLGQPNHFQFVEMGAGSGQFAKMILDILEGDHPNLYAKISYLIIERSPYLEEQQKTAFTDHHRTKISWISADAKEINSHIQNIEGIVFSNELPDTFPVHIIQKKDDRMEVAYIEWDSTNEKFAQRWMPISSLPDHEAEEIYNYLKLLQAARGNFFLNQALDEGPMTRGYPVNLSMIHWYQNISRALKRGKVITADYGAGRESIVTPNTIFPVYSFSEGLRLMGEAYLKYPGQIDVTSGVDMELLSAVGKSSGLKEEDNGLTSQVEYMESHGISDPTVIYGADRFHILRQSKNNRKVLDLREIRDLAKPVLDKFKLISQDTRNRLSNEDPYDSVLENDILPAVLNVVERDRLSDKSTRETPLHTVIFSGKGGSGKSEIMRWFYDLARTALMDRLDLTADEADNYLTVIHFDDYMLPHEDRPLDPHKNGPTNNPLLKFEVDRVINDVLNANEGKSVNTPIFDTKTRDRVKIGMDDRGRITLHNGSEPLTIMRSNGRLAFYKNGAPFDEENFHSIPVSITGQNGHATVKIKDTDHVIDFIEPNLMRRFISWFLKHLRLDTYPKEATVTVSGITRQLTREVRLEAWNHVDPRGKIIFFEGMLALAAVHPKTAELAMEARGKDPLSETDRETIRGRIHALKDRSFSIAFLIDFTARILRMLSRLQTEVKRRSDSPLDFVRYRLEIKRTEEIPYINDTLRSDNVIQSTTMDIGESIYVLFRDGALESLDEDSKAAIEGAFELLDIDIDHFVTELKKTHSDIVYLREKAGGDTVNQLQGTVFSVFIDKSGLVKKLPKDQDAFLLFEKLFFTALKPRMGGLMVPSSLVNLSEADNLRIIDYKSQKTGKVIVQNLIPTIGDRLESMRQSPDPALDRHRSLLRNEIVIIDAFFNLQRQMWERGIIDLNPNMVHKYGIWVGEDKESMLSFGLDGLTTNWKEFRRHMFLEDSVFPARLSQDGQDYYRRKASSLPKSAEEFKNKYFEKGLSSSRVLPDIYDIDISLQQMAYIDKLARRGMIQILRHQFHTFLENNPRLDRPTQFLIYTHLLLEGIYYSPTPQQTILKRFLNNLVSNPDLLETDQYWIFTTENPDFDAHPLRDFFLTKLEEADKENRLDESARFRMYEDLVMGFILVPDDIREKLTKIIDRLNIGGRPAALFGQHPFVSPWTEWVFWIPSMVMMHFGVDPFAVFVVMVITSYVFARLHGYDLWWTGVIFFVALGMGALTALAYLAPVVTWHTHATALFLNIAGHYAYNILADIFDWKPATLSDDEILEPIREFILLLKPDRHPKQHDIDKSFAAMIRALSRLQQENFFQLKNIPRAIVFLLIAHKTKWREDFLNNNHLRPLQGLAANDDASIFGRLIALILIEKILLDYPGAKGWDLTASIPNLVTLLKHDDQRIREASLKILIAILEDDELVRSLKPAHLIMAIQTLNQFSNDHFSLNFRDPDTSQLRRFILGYAAKTYLFEATKVESILAPLLNPDITEYLRTTLIHVASGFIISDKLAPSFQPDFLKKILPLIIQNIPGSDELEGISPLMEASIIFVNVLKETKALTEPQLKVILPTIVSLPRFGQKTDLIGRIILNNLRDLSRQITLYLDGQIGLDDINEGHRMLGHYGIEIEKRKGEDGLVRHDFSPAADYWSPKPPSLNTMSFWEKLKIPLSAAPFLETVLVLILFVRFSLIPMDGPLEWAGRLTGGFLINGIFTLLHTRYAYVDIHGETKFRSFKNLKEARQSWWKIYKAGLDFHAGLIIVFTVLPFLPHLSLLVLVPAAGAWAVFRHKIYNDQFRIRSSIKTRASYRHSNNNQDFAFTFESPDHGIFAQVNADGLGDRVGGAMAARLASYTLNQILEKYFTSRKSRDDISENELTSLLQQSLKYAHIVLHRNVTLKEDILEAMKAHPLFENDALIQQPGKGPIPVGQTTVVFSLVYFRPDGTAVPMAISSGDSKVLISIDGAPFRPMTIDNYPATTKSGVSEINWGHKLDPGVKTELDLQKRMSNVTHDSDFDNSADSVIFGNRNGVLYSLGNDPDPNEITKLSLTVYTMTVQPGSRFRLVLLTDGISDNLTSAEMDRLARAGSPANAAKKLVGASGKRSDELLKVSKRYKKLHEKVKKSVRLINLDTYHYNNLKNVLRIISQEKEKAPAPSGTNRKREIKKLTKRLNAVKRLISIDRVSSELRSLPKDKSTLKEVIEDLDEITEFLRDNAIDFSPNQYYPSRSAIDRLRRGAYHTQNSFDLHKWATQSTNDFSRLLKAGKINPDNRLIEMIGSIKQRLDQHSNFNAIWDGTLRQSPSYVEGAFALAHLIEQIGREWESDGQPPYDTHYIKEMDIQDLRNLNFHTFNHDDINRIASHLINRLTDEYNGGRQAVLEKLETEASDFLNSVNIRLKHDDMTAVVVDFPARKPNGSLAQIEATLATLVFIVLGLVFIIFPILSVLPPLQQAAVSMATFFSIVIGIAIKEGADQNRRIRTIKENGERARENIHNRLRNNDEDVYAVVKDEIDSTMNVQLKGDTAFGRLFGKMDFTDPAIRIDVADAILDHLINHEVNKVHRIPFRKTPQSHKDMVADVEKSLAELVRPLGMEGWVVNYFVTKNREGESPNGAYNQFAEEFSLSLSFDSEKDKAYLIHESLHALSKGGFAERRLNDGMTDYLTAYILKGNKPSALDVLGFLDAYPRLINYHHDVRAVARLVEIVGFDPLARAYFGLDTEDNLAAALSREAQHYGLWGEIKKAARRYEAVDPDDEEFPQVTQEFLDEVLLLVLPERTHRIQETIENPGGSEENRNQINQLLLDTLDRLPLKLGVDEIREFKANPFHKTNSALGDASEEMSFRLLKESDRLVKAKRNLPMLLLAEVDTFIRYFSFALYAILTGERKDLFAGSFNTFIRMNDIEAERAEIFIRFQQGKDAEAEVRHYLNSINEKHAAATESNNRKIIKRIFVADDEKAEGLAAAFRDSKIRIISRSQADTLENLDNLLQANAASSSYFLFFSENESEKFISHFVSTHRRNSIRMFRFISEAFNPLMIEFDLDGLNHLFDKWELIKSQA